MHSQQPQQQKHAPLRRMLAKGIAETPTTTTSSCRQVQNNSQVDHHHHLQQEHPLLFTPSQKIAPKSASSHCSLADSCYSSCSEGEHLALSRETSDSSNSSSDGGGNELALNGLAKEFGQKATIGREKERRMAELLEFTTRLGFTAEQLERALSQMDDWPPPEEDKVLAELIKLAKKEGKEEEAEGEGGGGGAKLARKEGEGKRRKGNGKEEGGGRQAKLRPIVVDGSNIAMSHGNKTVFSCVGIRECVNFFVSRGHLDILVFIPQFRKEQPRADAPIVDQHILMELEARRQLVWTPSRRVGGRRIVCHDDRYILKTAAEKQAIIVSNDEYRDLTKENAQWRTIVENHLLMYSFVDGKFMPPDDPLGRRGPSLDQFLTFAHIPLSAQPCPYAKKCTYGNKCKYFHPERPNGIRFGAADRLIAKMHEENQQKQFGNAKHTLATRPSLIAEGASTGCHSNLGRTRSLNLPAAGGPPHQNRLPSALCKSEAAKGTLMAGLPSSPSSAAAIVHYRIHPPLACTTSFSSPSAHHFPLSRIISAPPLPLPLPPTSSSSSFATHMFRPSASVWGDCEFSLTQMASKKKDNKIGPPADGQSVDCRQRLQYNLSQIFPESAVLAVMAAHPKETDAQRLCQRIMAAQKGFSQQPGETEQQNQQYLYHEG